MNNQVIDVPSEIKKYLVQDETIEKFFFLRNRFAFRGDDLYASNKRLFIKKGDTLRDISYEHISSIEFKQKRNWIAIALGALLATIGLQVILCGSIEWIPFVNDSNAYILLAVGFIFILLGFLRSQYIELTVVGFPKPYPLSGHRTVLDSLFKFIRERKPSKADT